MTHDEALQLLAGHPHIARFRELCADAGDAARRERSRALVLRLAAGTLHFVAATGGGPPPAWVPQQGPTTGPPTPTIPAQAGPALRRAIVEQITWRRRAEACPYREPCGCALARCHHLNRYVSQDDCRACITAARRPAGPGTIGGAAGPGGESRGGP